MSNNYDYSTEWDHRYCYPHSNVLINKLGIEDAEKLRNAEREITSVRIANAKINIIKGYFDLLHLRKIHRYILGDIYEWAGQIRWVNIAKGNMFCNYEFIDDNADVLLGELMQENFLKNTTEEQIPIRLSYYLSEINVIHPFREGNGRAQRVFIEYLAENAGYHVDFSQVTDRQMIEASADSFVKNYTKMNAIFSRITLPTQDNGMTQTFR